MSSTVFQIAKQNWTNGQTALFFVTAVAGAQCRAPSRTRRAASAHGGAAPCVIHFASIPGTHESLPSSQPQCCEHSDVYANSLGVFTRRACTGVLGTTLSRISLLQKLVSKHKAAKLDGLVLILEDDAHPKAAWDRRLETFLARHPQGSWDVAKLHGPSTLDQRSPTCFGEAAVLLHTRRARDVLIQLQRDVVSNSDVRVCEGQNDREGERRLRVVVSEETIFAPLQKHELGYAPSTMDGSGHSECQVSGFI